MAGIEIAGLSKVFPGEVTALSELDLSIEDGEFFALLGPSGCGKTTLLRTIAGLEPATAGTIEIGERDVTALPPGSRNVAMVFQDYALYPHMTVADNIAYPLKVQKVPKSTRYEEAEKAGESLSLHGLSDRRPGQLSGGQQQRVAVARAVATRPDVFLFDEPLSNLDAQLRLEARGFLKQLQQDLGTTTVYVTHDQGEALALADRMAVMESGVIRQVGAPRELFHRPANVFVAGFIGSTTMNLIPGTVENGTFRHESGDDTIPVGADPGHDGAVYYGIRPEYVQITDDGELSGTVAINENLGAQVLVSVEIGDQLIRAVVAEGTEPEVGVSVGLQPDTQRSLLYDRSSGELLSG